MGIEQLYTEIITEHNNSGRNKHHIENPTVIKKGVNPSCGDEIALELREKNGVIEDAAYRHRVRHFAGFRFNDGRRHKRENNTRG